jgi:hypothetical protein
MAVYWTSLYRGYAPGTATTVYTANTSLYNSLAIRSINMSNPTSQGVTVSVWIVPSGQAISNQYLVVPGWYLPPVNPTTGDAAVSQWTGFEILSTTGDQVIVQGSPGNVASITINGGVSK